MRKCLLEIQESIGLLLFINQYLSLIYQRFIAHKSFSRTLPDTINRKNFLQVDTVPYAKEGTMQELIDKSFG